MHTLRKHILLIIILLLSACGGGGSEPKPVVTTPPVTTPDPTITLTKLSDADTNIETSVFKIEGSDNISAFTFDLSNVASAYIVGNGQKTQITNNSVDVSGMNLKDYEVSVMHDTAGTMNLTVSNFTVNGKSYNYDSSAISVTFTKSEPVLNSNVQLNLYLMHKSVKISTEATSQVVKGEFPSTFYLSNLMQKVTKYNENLDSYEDYSEEEITLVDGTIDYHLPVGSYLIYLSGDRDTAGTSLTFKGSYEVNVTDINGGYSNSDHMYVSGLTESVINTMQDYDNQFVNGESKDFTLIDILTDADNNPILNSGYFFNILSYDVLSSSIESVTVRYYLTAFQPSKFYGIIFNSNLSAKVEVKLPTLNSPLSYDVNPGESLIVQEQYEIPAGEHIIDITISNVEYSGNDLQYEISGTGPFSVWTTDPSGSGGTSGNVFPIGPEATIKTIKIRE